MPVAPAASKPRTTARNEVKRDRLHLRLDTTSRHKLDRAAHYLNKSTSEFVLAQAVIAADKVIATHGQAMTLSEAQWKRFCQALDRPPKPNRKLKAAARRYARRGGELGD